MKKFFFIFIVILSEILNASEQSYLFNAYISAKSGLNLRSGPSISSSKITVVPFGEKCQVLEFSKNIDTIDGTTGKWAKVQYKDYNGWLFNRYLGNQNRNKDTRKFVFSNKINETGYITKQDGTLFFTESYIEEGKDYKDIDSLKKYLHPSIPYQSKVTILQYATIPLGVKYKGFDYVKVNYNNKIGWVSAFYVSKHPANMKITSSMSVFEILSNPIKIICYCSPSFKCEEEHLGFIAKEPDSVLFQNDTGNADGSIIYNAEYSNDKIIIYFAYYYNNTNDQTILYNIKAVITKDMLLKYIESLEKKGPNFIWIDVDEL